jgi:hypothetical protein
MDLQQLKESIQELRAPNYGSVKRSGATAVATIEWAREVLTEKLVEYNKIEILDQRARLIRDQMEHTLRRQNDYCFKDQRQSHYRDASILPHEKTNLIFEHMIPIRMLIAGLISGRVPLELALNPPTCLIRAESDALLRKAKVHTTISDPWNFWSRYEVLHDINFVTVRKDVVDVATWNLGTHCEYFKVFG